MTKCNLIHTLDALDYKAHVLFIRKSKDYKRTLWSEKHGSADIFTILPTEKFSTLDKKIKLKVNTIDYKIMSTI